MTTRIDAIAARLEAATPGPLHVASQAGASTGLWRVLQDGYETPLTHPDATEFGKFARLEDAVFAAFAPADVAVLLAVVRQVAEAHKAIDWTDPRRGEHYMLCGTCRTPAGFLVPWPCPTATALAPLTKEETDRG